MIDRLRNLLRSDALTPSNAVFPDIDIEKLSRGLNPKEFGRSRGKSNLPPSEQETLDTVEADIVLEVERLRRNGLESYNNNRRVYSERLRSAHTARSEIDTIAGTARGDFAKEVKSYRSGMARVEEDLQSWNEALKRFRERHRLERPAYNQPRLVVTLVILIACVIVETLLNGILFAGKNELGLLGGGFIALLISIVNVGFAGLAGFFARFAQHRYLLGKLLGCSVIVLWISGSLALNLAVAHFRDAIETLDSWSEATLASVETLLATPLDLASMESWLLLAWGILISILTFLKFLLSGESYPGYARISKRRLAAVEEFEEILDDALEQIEIKRDEAIENLNEANTLVREKIGDAIDALSGGRMIHSHLQTFLEQCDMVATTLLKHYRDANQAARSTDTPAYFGKDYRFPAFADDKIAGDAEEDRLEAGRKVAAVEKVVDETIAAIHEEYRGAIDAFANTKDLLTGNLLAIGTSRGEKTLKIASSNDATERVA